MGRGLFIVGAINENAEKEPRVQTNKGAEREPFKEEKKKGSSSEEKGEKGGVSRNTVRLN